MWLHSSRCALHMLAIQHFVLKDAAREPDTVKMAPALNHDSSNQDTHAPLFKDTCAFPPWHEQGCLEALYFTWH